MGLNEQSVTKLLGAFAMDFARPNAGAKREFFQHTCYTIMI